MTDTERRLRQLRDYAPVLARAVPTAWMVETIKDLIDDELARLAERPVIVFKPVCRAYGSETWAIHRADQPRRVYRCDLVGLTVAWLSIRDQGVTDTVRAGDFAEPGAAQAGTVVRTAIRRTALDWVERETGCLELAAAMRAIKVEGGQVRYRPGRSAPRFDTGE